MSYALQTHQASLRAASLSLSAVLWSAALIGLLSLGARMVELAPQPEPPVMEVVTAIEPKPHPPTPSEAEPRRSPSETTPIPAVLPPVSLDPPGPAAEPGPAIFAAPAPPPPMIVSPTWVRRPSGADLARFYPQRAIERGKSGLVTLDCLVRTTGTLACAVASEDPPNWGFGAAALNLSRSYQMVPATRDGAPVEARYTLRIPFQLE
jgi:periplasmic protein TonB